MSRNSESSAPTSVTRLRVLLVLHAISLIFVGVPLFLLVLALTAMVDDTDVVSVQVLVLVSILVVPSIPLNLLAAVHVKRRPSRSRKYLYSAAVLALLQLLMAIVFTISTRGLGILAVVIPGGLAVAWFVVTLRMRDQLDPRRPVRRPLLAAVHDLAIAALSIVLAAGLALATFWVFFERPRTPPEDFDEPQAWQKAEDAIAGAVTAFDDFQGFDGRFVRANPCLDEFAGGGEYVSYSVSYDFTSDVQASDQKQSEYASAAYEYWETTDGAGDLTLRVHMGTGAPSDLAGISARTGCVKRVPDPPCLEPQGGVPPANDEISNIDCP